MKNAIPTILFILFVIVQTVSAETVSGTLQEKGTRKPLADVNIYCFAPTDATVPLKAITDREGRFSLEVPDGRVRWKITVANYVVLDITEDASQSRGSGHPFYLEKQSYLVYETTVLGQNEKRDDKTKTLTQDQFLTIPGANGDPVKAVQNLPGVNRGNPLSAQVIIEGGAPQDTKYSVDTQQVPIIFHFSGLTSIVTPEAIDHVDYLSAGFGPEFGQTISGLVNLYTKDPKTDAWHGFGYLDIFNIGGMVEGPLNDHSSLLVGVRKSYVGAVLGAAFKNNPNLNLTVAPDFNDLVIDYKNKLSDTDDLKILGLGSIDTLGFALTQPNDQDPSIRGNFSQNTTFYRLIPEYTHHVSAETVQRVWLGLGRDSTSQSIGNFYYNNSGPVLSARAELETNLNDEWKTFVGFDNYMNWATINFQLPFSTTSQSGTNVPVGSSSLRTVANTYFLDNSAVYWRNILHAKDSRWTFLPGLRLDYYNQTNEYTPQPRFAARYALDDGLTLRGATGLYSQAPAPQNLDTAFGNPNLKSQGAVHATLGFEKDFKQTGGEGWTLSSDAFYKYLYGLVESTANLQPSGQPQYYNNDGTGKVYGLENLVKYQGRGWSGWIAYTLSRSTRIFPPAGEQVFQYDQTHSLTLIADHDLPKNWKISGRARYVTGNPYTPNTGGSFDADNDVYIPTAGGAYSQRIGSFFQLDARVDKKWIKDTWILTAYLDVENLTNASNPELVNYSYNYQQQSTITGLPLLPTLGVKGSF